jgi:uncharacterized cupredoxin-like copper-binding protein
LRCWLQSNSCGNRTNQLHRRDNRGQAVGVQDRHAQDGAGGSTTFKVTNTGKELHNFEIEGNGIEKRVGKLNPGETKTLLVELKPGKYEVYCPVPGHKSHGMSLDLTVR